MSELKLSIIVPVYNAEAYLEKNMMTIIKQLGKSCELILVNDGSTDDTPRICSALTEYCQQVIFINKTNEGVSMARNAGIERARGEYLTFVDSDDYVADEYISRINTLLNNQADLYLFNNYVKGESVYIEKKFLTKNESKMELEEVYNLFLNYKINAPWDKVFIRDIIEKNQIRFLKNQNMGEDLIFCLEYLKYVKSVISTKECLYYHTVNKNGLCHRKISIEQFNEQNRIFESLLDFSDQYAIKYIDSVCITILRNGLNFCGKLAKSGCGVEIINTHLRENIWYERIINNKYHGIVDKFRRFLMKHSLFKLSSIFFSS